MFVGVLRVTLYLPQPGSLKSKRQLLRSAIDRVKAKYNVSIAEVAENDLLLGAVPGGGIPVCAGSLPLSLGKGALVVAGVQGLGGAVIGPKIVGEAVDDAAAWA